MSVEAVKKLYVNGYSVSIFQDDSAESPREWDNVGTMQSFESRFGPNELSCYGYEFNQLVVELADKGANFKTHTDDIPDVHIWRALRKHWIVLPFWRDHYGEYTVDDIELAPSDCSCDGVIFMAVSDMKNRGFTDRERAIECLKSEAETYGQYASGDVYGFVIEDEHGEHIDSCWGFYGLEYCISEAKGIASRLDCNSGVGTE